MFTGFPCDGIWLVQTTPGCKSSACIMQIDDLPSVYPFAQMAVSADDLVKFLGDLEKRAQEKTGVYKDVMGKPTLVSWTGLSHQDTAMAILKWMAEKVGQPAKSEKMLLTDAVS